MSIVIHSALLDQLHLHLENAYPGEGAGFLLGSDASERREVTAILTLPNAREESARSNRFLLTAEDYLKGELEAERTGLTLLGVFHSHPDCPNQPSEYDREWAMPWFSYIITRVDGWKRSGRAVSDLSWRLEENRLGYHEENLIIV
jgi:proteasome lid subunit RPN8/RPN11